MTIANEQATYRNGKPSMLGRGIDKLTNPIGKALGSVVPSSILEGLLEGIDRAVGAPTLITFDHDRTDMEACRKAAKRVERIAKAVSASTGAASGLGGVLTMSFDIPATMAVAIRNILDTSRAYGFEGDGNAERLFRLRILELAALDGSDEREKRIARLEAGIATDGSLVIRNEQQVEPLVDQAVERVSRAIAFNAFRTRAGMLMPLIGSAVGGFVNASFQSDVSKAARFAYQARRRNETEKPNSGAVR